MEIKRHPKDRGFGYKKAYEYEESIRKDIEPTEKDWQELKEKLPNWICEGIIFALGTSVALLIASTLIYSLLRVIYGV
tara:strand:+ start:2033 stop:2266 length:234 start_codon:yes stop_codon:yes gene_type:complete